MPLSEPITFTNYTILLAISQDPTTRLIFCVSGDHYLFSHVKKQSKQNCTWNLDPSNPSLLIIFKTVYSLKQITFHLAGYWHYRHLQS